jgi:hypothetical protein
MIPASAIRHTRRHMKSFVSRNFNAAWTSFALKQNQLRSLTGRRQSRQPCRRRNTGLSRLPLSAGSLPLR